ERSISNRQLWRAHAAPLQLTQHGAPAFSRFAETILDRDQLLRAIRSSAENHQCAETILFQTNVEVNTIRPDIDVVAIAQVPRAERLVLVHPARQQLADVARRQAGRFLSEERLQRLLEIARRQTAQIQDRQHLGHLRRASHVRRQNRTREALSASIAVHSSVVDSRRRDLDRTRPYGHLPRLRPAVTHHEGMSAIVALITMPLEVRRYFSIESRDQHLP